MSSVTLLLLLIGAWWLSGFLLIQACMYLEAGAAFGGEDTDYTIGMLLYEIMGGFIGLLFLVTLTDILYQKYWCQEAGARAWVYKIMDLPLKNLFITKDKE